MSLLQDVAQQAIEGWMEENHPLVNTSCCLNSKQRKFVCTECRDICPKGVFDSAEHRWDLCDDCNLCVVACPSEAICPSMAFLRSFLQLPNAEQEAVTIACGRGEAAADLQVSCLATLPWEMIARIAFDKTLVLDIGPCASCQKIAEKDQLQVSLSRAEIFLGTDHFAEHVRLGAEGTERAGVSRREAFSAMWSMFRRTVGSFLPGEGLEKPADGALYRKVLVSRLLKMEEQGPHLEVTWDTPVFSSKCTACTVCSKICVHHAIEVVDDGEDEGVQRMLHYGHRCVRCGLCETLCPQSAIEGWTTYTAASPLEPAETAVAVEAQPVALTGPALRSISKRDWLREKDSQATTGPEA
jgi:formate hydrogenlyase subunit 6/NADH:ubiquinone oxidoreductase subunit I